MKMSESKYMSNIMISLIIPMYNSGDVIERCLVSLMNQSFRDIEIIVVDDGSTDNGADVVLNLAAKDDRIRYILQENRGVSSARNHGLDEAKGEWICFIDSDDEVAVDYLSSMYSLIEETHCDIAMCGFRSIRENYTRDVVLSEEKMKSLSGNLREDLVILREYISSPCMKIFSKERIEALHLRFREDMVLAEDRYFNNHYYTMCNTVAFVNRPQYIYHRSNTGLSRAATCACFEDEMENLAYMIHFMEKDHIEQRESLIAEYISQCMRRYISMPGEKNTFWASRRRLKTIRQYHKPAELPERNDAVLYRLLCMRLYFMIWLCFRINRKMINA